MDLKELWGRRSLGGCLPQAEREVQALRLALDWTSGHAASLGRLLACSGQEKDPAPREDCLGLLRLADQRRAESGEPEIRLLHLLRALAEQDWTPAASLLSELKVSRRELLKRISKLADTVEAGAGLREANPETRNTVPEPRGTERSVRDTVSLPLVEAVLAVDMCDSTGIGHRYGDQLLVRLKRALRDIASAAAEQHSAAFTKGTGDGYLMTFPRCGQAVSAAQDMLKATRGYNASHPAQPAVSLRFGINFGEVHADSLGDRTGSAVNLAFRVQDTKAEDMHETKQGIRKADLSLRDRIFVTHNVFKELSAAGSAFECLKLGYFDCKGFDGMRIAVYEISPPAHE